MKHITRKLAHAHLKPLRKLAENDENRRNLTSAVKARTGGTSKATESFVRRALRDRPEDMVEPTLGAALLLEECAEAIRDRVKGKR